ncbi:MAG: DUF1772 domain-containing protein [Roseitalea sp.]|jgi:uncharacterized membrane protein|nr:DUF1772 domain-containing protein [Roseitalea sp.]MBO6720845.1 DUF1772 domain-containing protein [Roseitalea sp.]MBO6743150.1 DUF1772 domain-containing protein [Roseitalea sp.]
MVEITRAAQMVPITMLGLMAGFFYAFSVCVMAGLDAIAPERAISAMQAINAAVRNPVFFVTFFLTPVIAGGTAALAFASGETRIGSFMAAAAVVYVLAAALPTALVNVPLNEALAAVDPERVDAAAIWSDYSARWTFWNTARTLTTTLALALAVFPLFESR